MQSSTGKASEELMNAGQVRPKGLRDEGQGGRGMMGKIEEMHRWRRQREGDNRKRRVAHLATHTVGAS